MPSVQQLRQKLGKPGGASNQDLRQRIQKVQQGQHRNGQGGGNRFGEAREYFKEQRRAGPSQIPYSGAYETEMGDLTNELNQTTADITGQRLALSQRYGIGDTSNPYSLARQLETQRENQTRATTNTMAAGGQLYAGSTSNAHGIDRQNYNLSQDELLRNYASETAGLTSAEQEARNRYAEGRTGAEAERLEEALSTPPDPTEAPNMPPAARKYLQHLKQRQRQAQKGGKENQAQRLKDRIRRLR